MSKFRDWWLGRTKRTCSYCGEYLRAEIKWIEIEPPEGIKNLGLTKQVARGKCPQCGNTEKEWHAYASFRMPSSGDYVYHYSDW